ncbi:MAG: hypothetical protein VB133_15980 [Anaeromusa sp.]|uniref:hypothetical protein n=1 Tax=Anaeromusa sp. TaxID=1872520 RepID=UPI002B201022|nr:hypothetical protein [Anaeromusa sp.]MEA4836605.1 hypothetical protein [Anaeromusa sp.]
MKPDEVVQLLNEIGIPVSVPTLARYVREKLISEPQRGGHGRGGGRWTEYSLYGVVEAATTWKLLNGKIVLMEDKKQTIRFSPRLVRFAKDEALLNFGKWISGTEGAKFINPEFVLTDGVDNTASKMARIGDLVESMSNLEQSINERSEEDKKFIIDKQREAGAPEWFPIIEVNNCEPLIFIRFVNMLQVAYVREYGKSILSIIPKLDNKN